MRQYMLLDHSLHSRPQQITTIHCSTSLVRKSQIFRLAMLRPLPSCVENCPQDSERIERNATTPSICLGVVEFAFIEAFYDFNAVGMNSSPPQRGYLSDTQRTNNHQCHNRFCWFRQSLDYTADVL